MLSVRSIWGAFEVLCWFEFEVLTFEYDVTPYRMKFESVDLPTMPWPS
jgi:hypothetical protein